MPRFLNLNLNLFAVLPVAALLAACATTPPPRPDAPVAPYRDAISLTGRLSANYLKEGQGESVSGQFTWAQTPRRIHVVLSSPLGQTIATISVTPEAATLTQADKVPRVAPDIDSLSAQTLGWSLPVSGLRDWLQGYATSADGSRFVASPGRDSVLTHDGWRVRYVSWQDGPLAHPQPRRIDAERGAGSADALAIRIVIDTRTDGPAGAQSTAQPNATRADARADARPAHADTPAALHAAARINTHN